MRLTEFIDNDKVGIVLFSWLCHAESVVSILTNRRLVRRYCKVSYERYIERKDKTNTYGSQFVEYLTMITLILLPPR